MKRTGRKSSSKREAYVRGYFTGKAEVYCEQVNAGSKLAALLVCRREWLGMVLDMVQLEGLRSAVFGRRQTQVKVWIYKQPFVRRLIASVARNKVPTATSVWSTGKLFGYSDTEIATFLYQHRLVRSAFRLESSRPRNWGNRSSRKGAFG